MHYSDIEHNLCMRRLSDLILERPPVNKVDTRIPTSVPTKYRLVAILQVHYCSHMRCEHTKY